MKKLLFILITHTSISYSLEPMDNYYADDLIDAVNQAKERPHHYDYSSTYRYKRTTAQSIELNRLDLEEMDETRLDMQGESISLLPSDDTSLQLNTGQEDASPDQNQARSILIQNNIPVSSQYQSNQGALSSKDMLNQGSLVSTPRP